MSHKKSDSSSKPEGNAPFQAKKRALHEDEHGGAGHGGTEMGWLVSYADMMTLLFGLFVVLFSLANDKTKNVEDVMRDVSKKYFSSQDGNQPVPSAKLPEQTQQPVKPAVKDITQTAPPVPEAPKSNPADEVKAIEQAAQEEKKELTQKIEELTASVKSLQQEKAKALKEQKSAERKVASTPEPDAEIKKQVESLQSELEKKKHDNEELQKELEAQKNKSPSQNYMMVLLTWETEKHDVDLQVVTPHQKTFNFKNRKVKNEPGSFELDSRFGPGIEMWKSENFVPGGYTAKLNLYNKNGNDKDALVQVTVVTNLGTYKSKVMTLSDAKKNTNVNFNIDDTGSVEFKSAP